LEGLAAQLAAEAITSNKVDILNAALQQLVKAAKRGSWKDFADADFGLHKTIIQLSGHRRLQEHGSATFAEQIAKGHNTDGKALVEHLPALERKTPILREG